MMLDYRQESFHRFRTHLSIITLPFEYIVSVPIDVVHWVGNSATSHQHLLDENAQLRAKELLLQAEIQRVLELEKENVQLKQLLGSTSFIKNPSLVARFLSVNIDPYSQSAVINRGKKQGIYEGQPIVDAYGVIGQVVEVGLVTSKALFITDSRTAVPVQNYRNGVRAIAIGIGESDRLKLIYVPKTSDIQVGDLFVTSGLGQQYPIGYPLGKVVQFNYHEGNRFATVYLEPAGHVDRSQQVLLVWLKPPVSEEAPE